MKQVDEYSIFIDLGKNEIPPSGYTKIKVYLIYAFKLYTRHRARYVADGHIARLALYSVYLGVVSSCLLHMMIFVAELNQLDT